MPDLRKRAGQFPRRSCLRAVLVKGGHLENEATDVLFDGREFLEFAGDRQASEKSHGSGCVFSAAITAAATPQPRRVMSRSPPRRRAATPGSTRSARGRSGAPTSPSPSRPCPTRRGARVEPHHAARGDADRPTGLDAVPSRCINAGDGAPSRRAPRPAPARRPAGGGRWRGRPARPPRARGRCTTSPCCGRGWR